MAETSGFWSLADNLFHQSIGTMSEVDSMMEF
jgi:hypothetical protein